jgi:hypothetical protein
MESAGPLGFSIVKEEYCTKALEDESLGFQWREGNLIWELWIYRGWQRES